MEMNLLSVQLVRSLPNFKPTGNIKRREKPLIKSLNEKSFQYVK